jgi:HEAT repeat protein
MGRSANQRWKDFVLTHLLSPSPQLRLVSVVAVGELEVKEALEEILELIDDVDIKIRNASVWSLSQIGGSRAADILAELFNAAEDGEELQLIEDAFDNLAFADGTRDMLIFDHDDEEESAS